MSLQPDGTWVPGPRPAWVQHALDGEGGPVYALADEPFDPDALVAEACLRAGSDDLGPDTYREPLERFCHSLDAEADLHLVGRWRVREVILRNLENRARLVDTWARHPTIADEVVDRPMVVTGQPRAGTSILHQLLSLAPDARAPLAWEYWCPTPPPLPATAMNDPRIPLANRDVRLSAALAPGFDGMHEQGALLPREDGSAMNIDMRGDPLVAHYPVPSFAAWFHEADHTSGYAWWKRVLQTLQLHDDVLHAGGRWVTKMPGHMAALPTLIDTFPDARIVVCHRDPLEMLSSVTSLLATLRWAHARRVDFHALAREQADYYVRILDRLVDACAALPADRVVHVHFAAFNADQLGAVRTIHDHFGIEFTAAHSTAIAQHLADRPAGRHGGHQHRFADLGLDESDLRRRFERYQRTFDVPSEPV